MTAPKQKSLAIPGEPAPAPQPLFDGGPKEPTVGRHKDHHFLSWAFHRTRFNRLGDRFFDPWLGKHLASCKKIMALARGDREEVKRRMANLLAWCEDNPDFWQFTPQKLLGSWDALHMPPSAVVGGRQTLRNNARRSRRGQYLQELEG